MEHRLSLTTDEQKTTNSTSTSLSGGDLTSEWNQIGNISELNEKTDAIRSLREYTQSELLQNNDGGFNKADDVLFFSKIDKQYIPGVVKDKKKDKLTKDYVYKIQKTHKRDPDVDEELSGKKRSAKEDPRVEIIKFREQRAKKTATITYNTKEPVQSYYKILSANDYQIELQLSLLKILKTKVSGVIKKRKKIRKLSSKASTISNKMKKSKQKRDNKQRMAATFSTRQQLLDLSKNKLSKISAKRDSKNRLSPRYDSKNTSSPKGTKPNRSSRHIKHAMSVGRASFGSVNSDYSEDGSNTPIFYVNKPEGDPKTWTQEDVLTWLQYISQQESAYEDDKNLSEEERKNYKKARKTLLENYFEKFINADIDGKVLEKLDNVTLRSKVYMNNAMDRKIVVKCLEDLFGERKQFVKASHYAGSEYDFSKDWKKSMRAEIEFQKRKLAAGDLSKMKMKDIGRSSYKGTQWTQDLSDATSGDIYKDKVNKHSKQSSFLLRKKKAGMKKHKTVAEIGMADDYVIPDYADEAIADTMVGQATDERSRWGKAGMDIEGANKDLLKMLLHANVHIPPELTTPVKGYHTIQNRNAQLRNLLLKHQAMMDEEDIENNPELMREKALKEARQKADKDIAQKEMDALKSGNLTEMKKMYGGKHKKVRQIRQIMDQAKKEEKRSEAGRKYRKRQRENQSSLALIKKKKKEISSSNGLTDIKKKYGKENDNNGNKHVNKHTRRSQTMQELDFVEDEDNDKKRHKKKKPKRKKSKKDINTKKGLNTPDKTTKIVSFAAAVPETKKKKKRVSFALPDDDDDEIKSSSIPRTALLNNHSNVSDGTVILHSGTTPRFGDDLFLSPDSRAVSTGSIEPIPLLNVGSNEDDEIFGHNKEYSVSKTMIIHSNQGSFNASGSTDDSLSFDATLDDATWNVDDEDINTNKKQHAIDFVIPDSADDLSSSSSEITFSSDDDDDDDDNDNDDGDGDAVPLSILRLRAQEQEEKKDDNCLSAVPPLSKILSGEAYD